VAGITGACPLSRKVLLLAEVLWPKLLLFIFIGTFEVLVVIKGWEGF
jgi:hypothetical protein